MHLSIKRISKSESLLIRISLFSFYLKGHYVIFENPNSELTLLIS